MGFDCDDARGLFFFFPPDDLFFNPEVNAPAAALTYIYVIISLCWSFIAPTCSRSKRTETYAIPAQMCHLIGKFGIFEELNA